MGGIVSADATTIVIIQAQTHPNQPRSMTNMKRHFQLAYFFFLFYKSEGNNVLCFNFIITPPKKKKITSSNWTAYWG